MAFASSRPQGRPPKYCVWEKHGMYRTPTHITWKSMLHRCLKTDHEQYGNYGARGITVCERWLRFTNFLADMGERPSGMTLDRIDTYGNYEPGNCRWATAKTQRQNSRQRIHWITHNGDTLCLLDWSRKLGIRANHIRWRIAQGWPTERALSTTRFNNQGRAVSA